VAGIAGYTNEEFSMIQNAVMIDMPTLTLRRWRSHTVAAISSMRSLLLQVSSMGGLMSLAPTRGREDREGGDMERRMKSASVGVSLLAVTTGCCSVAAFLPLRHSSISPRPQLLIHCHHTATTSSSTRLKDRKADENDREIIIDSELISQRDRNSNIPNDMGLEIIRGSESDLSDEIWGDIEGGAPSQWMVMKNVSYLDIPFFFLHYLQRNGRNISNMKFNVCTTLKILGVNIFTYILVALIVFFLSANAILGPGWLGQSLGWENVGTFTKVSDSLPLSVDVSRPEFLL
jgi:hypothetical protein